MSPRRQTPIEIVSLAQDLGLRVKSDPVDGILNHCEKKFKQIIVGHEFSTLTELLSWTANKVGTSFREIISDSQLREVRDEFCERGERAFANLDNELNQDVYGITYKLLNAHPWEPSYISLIDCRGNKSARAYFTKWHEIAHLLTLTDQRRLVFRRTHASVSQLSPEERMMDLIAGKLGFYGPFFHKFIKHEISFAEIERLRNFLCPEASQQASLINFVKYWNAPCIYLEIRKGFNKNQKAELRQGNFDFMEPVIPVLRGVHASVNDLAREIDFSLFDNMRIPQASVIYRCYENGDLYGEAEENLSLWKGSVDWKIQVKVRNLGETLEALIFPKTPNSQIVVK